LAESLSTGFIGFYKRHFVCANVFVAAESSWAEGRPDVPATVRRGARWIGGKRVADKAPLRYLTSPYHYEGVRHAGGSPSRIAFFGLMTRDLTSIVSTRPNAGVAVGDPVAIAKALVPKLRREADVVVCLSHMGLDADRELAERVPGIDVIIGGHSHIALKRPILVNNGTPNGYHGTVIAQAGSRGEYLGRTVLYTENDRPVRFAGKLLSVRPADGEAYRVAALLRPYADSISAAMSKPVFQTKVRIPSSSLREGETPLGNFVADVMRDAVNADIALINSGGIRAALPAGTVTVGDVYSVLPFDNRIVVIPMPGWRVRELLDFAGRRIGKGGFGQVSGVSFVIKGDRAGNIRVNGELIDSNRTYRVATVDYLYDGGDGYTIFGKAGPAEETGILLRDAAIQFLAEHPDYEFRKEGRIVWEGSMRGF
jgi:2',3'-cyclic-nucleotide 2'-phosphodiesterase (5'-nucleotidase family)